MSIPQRGGDGKKVTILFNERQPDSLRRGTDTGNLFIRQWKKFLRLDFTFILLVKISLLSNLLAIFLYFF
jgi:hypothetical protein